MTIIKKISTIILIILFVNNMLVAEMKIYSNKSHNNSNKKLSLPKIPVYITGKSNGVFLNDDMFTKIDNQYDAFYKLNIIKNNNNRT